MRDFEPQKNHVAKKKNFNSNMLKSVLVDEVFSSKTNKQQITLTSIDVIMLAMYPCKTYVHKEVLSLISMLVD